MAKNHSEHITYNPVKYTVPENATVYPITKAQSMLKWQEFWSLQRWEAKLGNILDAYVLIENGDLEALEKTFNEIVKRNDAFRAVIFKKGLKDYQYIRDYEYKKLEVVDLGDAPDALENYLKELKTFIIYWRNVDLVWAQLIKVGNKAGLVIRMHHACSDGYSIGLVFKMINKYYDCFVKGETPPEEKEFSVLKFAEFQEKYLKSEMHKEDRKFWWHAWTHQRKFSYPAGYCSLLGDVGTASRFIDGSDYEKLVEYAKNNECPLANLMMSFAALATYSITGKDNFSIYSLTHGRRTPYLKQTVGPMMNTVPIFYDILDKKQNTGEYVAASYMNYLETLAHGQLPMAESVPYTYVEAFKHFLNFNPSWCCFSSLELGAAAESKDKEIHMMPFSYMVEQFYLCVMDIPGKQMNISLNFQAKKFKQEQVEKYIDAYKCVILETINNPDACIEDIIKSCRKKSYCKKKLLKE